MTSAWYERNKQKSNAIGAIVQAEDSRRILLGCRSVTSDSPKTWCNFGGGIELDEAPIDALVREFVEEVGIKLDVSRARPLAVFKSPAKDFAFFTLYLQVPSEFKPRINHEHIGWCWSSLDALPQPMHPGCNDTFSLPEVFAWLRSR